MYRIVKRITVLLVILHSLYTTGWGQEARSSPHLNEGTWPFFTADRCIACHSGLSAPSGEDVSIGYDWRSSMMANSARDPYWQASVRRELLDHPEAREALEDKCSTCHMPMSRFRAASAGGKGIVFGHLGTAGEKRADDAVLALDGVSCAVCHQIRGDNFGETESFTGGFLIDTDKPLGQREIFGPFEVDAGRKTIMRSASRFVPEQSTHLTESELCATCHTLYTHALNSAGEEVGELPEQVPYLEWRHSEYSNRRSCQGCHMPQVNQDVPISSVLGEPRAGLSRHVFRGGNAFMLGLLNKYRTELGVKALPVEFDAAVQRTRRFLRDSTAGLALSVAREADSRLRIHVSVESLAGHKLPSAYPSRRVWLHLLVEGGDDEVLFESGALQADGSILGNDNDADPARYEPHYREITRPDQVQIYEPIMVDSDGRLTTGLLFGVRYIKDNRLLPRGFDKGTAGPDIAVHGQAFDDDDFRGGRDDVRYQVDVGSTTGHLKITAELWYQTIAYRWARNLEAYPAPEVERFVRYYEATAGSSATLLARETHDIEL